MKYKIEKVSATDEKEALQTLIITLVNDPGIIFFSPDATQRVYHTMRMVKAMSGLLAEFGDRYMIKEKGKIVAVAMWVPPGKSINNWRLIRVGFFLIPFIMGLRVFRRIMKFLDIATRLQEEHMKGRNHWHLFYLGVHPAFQRRGYGKSIISDIIAKSDKTKLPIFVQSFTEVGQKFFQKNGFQIVSKTKFSDDCIMNCMVRESIQKKSEEKKPAREKTLKSKKGSKSKKAVNSKKTVNQSK